ncbi:MAG: hypothetical protein JKY29_11940, partial [Gammaproteobacteria bacterium]|nr:hypothetical protein [Gammaproteobacteria bacterium]
MEFKVVRAVVSFNKNVDVRGLDKHCSQWKPDNKTQLICTIPLLKAESFLLLSYYIVGEVNLRPGFVASLSVTSLDDSIAVSAQDSSSVGLSDGSRFIEGSALSISVARDILRD